MSIISTLKNLFASTSTSTVATVPATVETAPVDIVITTATAPATTPKRAKRANGKATAAVTLAPVETATAAGLDRHAAYVLRGHRAHISRLANEAKRLADSDPAMAKAIKLDAANKARLVKRQLTAAGLPVDYKA